MNGTGRHEAMIGDASDIIARFTDGRENDFDPLQRADRRWTAHALSRYLDVSSREARDIGYDFTHSYQE